MEIVVCGLNHRTAPIELRERFMLAGCGPALALADLQSLPEPAIAEAAVLATCHRFEIYAAVRDAAEGLRILSDFLARLEASSREELAPHLYRLAGREAARHLFRVAAGLDSVVLGEPQILGQVGQAAREAERRGTSGPLLDRLFALAVHAGRRARAETDIGRHPASLSHAGARRLMEALLDRAGRARVLVIGAGEMAALAADAALALGAAEVAFTNRTFISAEVLAAERKGRAFPWHEVVRALAWADGVISATGAPHVVLAAAQVRKAQRRRGGRPLPIVDLAVPRDVEPAARETPGVSLWDVDDLRPDIDESLRLREAAVPAVEAILEEELLRFEDWRRSREVAPLIRDLREWAEGVAREEAEAALRSLGPADARTKDAIERLARRLVGRLLHEPTVRLRRPGPAGQLAYADAVRELFGLDRRGR
ncbi:MAG: glutamyl-tRNA reductase [Clostridia bacterium]|nr:glutamyl-tRNA reductase [Clostridia bacterium]